tara:strand:- start:79 stop:312 length:234 start_codon:yes stop_codon:yes gene_type:complete
MTKKKNKTLDKLASETLEIPTKDGKTVIAKAFEPRILTAFIQEVLENTKFEDLNKQDKEDVKVAVHLIYPEYEKYVA